jgi:hypothetical protein
MKSSWFFDIHEDTPEQEMTNLLQHGTCVLDISSDEESEQKARRERAEGRDKENVPPADDVSQTSSAARRTARQAATEDDMVVEKERVALGEMRAADFYAAGCDESSVVLVPGDEEAAVAEAAKPEPVVSEFEFAPEIALEHPLLEPLAAPLGAFEEEPLEPLGDARDVDELMGKDGPDAKAAALLEPIEGTGECFELWESGSAKDETEGAAVVEER